MLGTNGQCMAYIHNFHEPIKSHNHIYRFGKLFSPLLCVKDQNINIVVTLTNRILCLQGYPNNGLQSSVQTFNDIDVFNQ
jgi:hypothetical protein